MGSAMSTLKQVGFFSLACVHLYCVSKLAEPGSNLFSWHPFLSSAAFGLIMPEAFTQISRLSEFGRRFSHRNRVTMHWVLQSISVILAGVGLACIFINKNQFKRPHLTTYHSWLGLSTFLYAVLQSLGGLFIMYPKWKPSFAPGTANMKVYHAVSAASLMLCASATMFFSNYSLWFAKHKLNTTVYATGMWIYPAVLALRALWTVYESGAFGRLMGKPGPAPLADSKDTSSL
ncbi:putative Cytochrome b561 domain-containing protein 1 [Hypsibius exemplaris]|uniref:ascorbate ferrireductase (transmembrane) n=1 Tax=Hypsibius exemplaris TaxID=2072580 RepID=A0A1W0WE26_HYPEX|nr:putative Cytochrome b561 domain-containing protein 1 [Hypsibius exemplaris]